MKITNNSDIPLALAVWLLHDEYDYIDKPNYISATKLLKPVKELVLSARVDYSEVECDLTDYISRALGHSLHDSIEKSWKLSFKSSLAKLGYPQHVIDRVLINPTDEELAAVKDAIPVYLEQRGFRKIRVNGIDYIIGGKFDMVAEGIVHDNKSTSAYTWVFDTNDENYKLQGSIYRWINPKKITEDFIRINFIFTDWQKAQAKANADYPQQRLAKKEVPLLSEEKTGMWIAQKIKLLVKYKDSPESEIPPCSREELWMSDDQFKYYSDPAKTDGRATRNFKTLAEANAFKAEKGKGIVKVVPGVVKRCAYCSANTVCEQGKPYL